MRQATDPGHVVEPGVPTQGTVGTEVSPVTRGSLIVMKG